MRWESVIGVVSLVSVAIASIPLTVNVPAFEKKCLYVRAHRENAKIRAVFTVMAGGQFDIDASLTRPDNTVAERVKKSEGEEWLMNAPEAGDYELCFYNEMSTFVDKSVEFEFEIDTNSVEARLPDPANEEHTLEMERFIANIDKRASLISRNLNHLKARNARNESTVKSTARRVWWFTVLELLAIVGMAAFNVTIVQVFFKGSRKNIV